MEKRFIGLVIMLGLLITGSLTAEAAEKGWRAEEISNGWLISSDSRVVKLDKTGALEIECGKIKFALELSRFAIPSYGTASQKSGSDLVSHLTKGEPMEVFFSGKYGEEEHQFFYQEKISFLGEDEIKIEIKVKSLQDSKDVVLLRSLLPLEIYGPAKARWDEVGPVQFGRATGCMLSGFKSLSFETSPGEFISIESLPETWPRNDELWGGETDWQGSSNYDLRIIAPSGLVEKEGWKKDDEIEFGVRIKVNSPNPDEISEGIINKEEVPYKWTSSPLNGLGSLKDVAIDPKHPNIVYVAGDVGGMYKSTDYGDNWRIINQGLLYRRDISVATIAIDPVDTNILYIGTGCIYIKNAGPGNGAIFKSEDGGETWHLLTREIAFAGHGNYGYEGGIAVDPKDTKTIYAGSFCQGVFKSMDGGRNWVNKGLKGKYITSLYLDPKNSKIIYVACGREIGLQAFQASRSMEFQGKGGLFKSIDGGESWIELPGLDDARDLAIDPNDTKTLYITGWDKGVYKSTDGGKSWLPKNNGLIPGYGNRMFREIAVAGDSTLYVSSVDGWPLQLTGLYKSVDGGENWQKIPESINANVHMGDHWLNQNHFCWGPTCLVVDPNNPERVYMAAPGIWRSDDGGKNWQIRCNGLECSGVLSLAVDPNIPDRIYIGTGDNSFFISKDGGNSARARYPSPASNIASIVVDPTRPRIWVSDLHWRGGKGVFATVDEGNWWERLEEKVAEGSPPWDIIYILVGDPSNPGVLYAGTDKGIYRGVAGEEQFGRSLKEPWKLLSSEVHPRAIAINSKNPNILYVRCENFWKRPKEKGIFKSVDGGKNWQPINNGLPLDAENPLFEYPLIIDPNNPEILYAGGFSNGLYQTIDGGKLWKRVFPGDGVSAIAIDPKDSTIYLANTYYLPGQCPLLGDIHFLWNSQNCPTGIYRSKDRGKTWEHLSNDGLQSCYALQSSLVLDPHHKGRIYLGTNGDGYFRGDPK